LKKKIKKVMILNLSRKKGEEGSDDDDSNETQNGASEANKENNIVL